MNESMFHIGFFEIPDHSNYCISKKGEVINKTTGKKLRGSSNPAGYRLVRLKDNEGTVYTWGIHRLLLFVFDHLNFCKTKVGNHLDGNKKNNDLSNLELTTYQGNAEHAGRLGLTTKCRPVSAKDVNTGCVTEYPSATACGKATGFSKDAILWRLKVGESVVFPERVQYRCGRIKGVWENPTVVKKNKLNSKSVHVRHLVGDHLFSFDSLTAVSLAYGIKTPSLSIWINNPEQPVIPGKLQIKWEDDKTPWREVSDPQLELEKTTGVKAIVVTDIKTGISTLYPTMKDCSAAMNLPLSNLSFWVKKKGLIEIRGFKFILYRDLVSITHDCNGNSL